VVVEAARRSGSLVTARFANEQGREVFAVPGSPLDPRAEGTNDLLRQGAMLCARPEDVIETLAQGKSTGGDLFDDYRPLDQNEPLYDELDLFPAQEGLNFAESAPPQPFAPEPAPTISVMTPAPASGERLVELLGSSPLPIDELIRLAGLPARDVHALLLELDLSGRLERHGANAVSLLPNDK